MRVRTHRSRLAHGLAALATLVLLATLVPAGPASAHHCTGGGQIDDRGGDVVAECHGATPGRPGSVDVSELWGSYCAAWVGGFLPGDGVEFVATDPLTVGDVEHLGFDPTGVYWWWNVTCFRDGEPVHMHEFAVEETPPVPPEVLRDIAAARLDPPAPAPVTSPPLGRPSFVGVATWLWLDPGAWVVVEESETRGFTTVTVRAAPVLATWTLGDEAVVTCWGPGVAWTSGLSEDATDCSHMFEHSSYGEPEGRFEASVTVTWEFEWWINTTYQGVFGTVDVASPFVVAVAEIQAVETGGQP